MSRTRTHPVRTPCAIAMVLLFSFSASTARSNEPPTVQITCPEPSGLVAHRSVPEIRIVWEGFDPDGGTTSPVEYKHILLSPASEFPPSLAIQNPDSLRRYYVNHPNGPWAGWDSTSAETTETEFTNLLPSGQHVFAVIAFDDDGAYSQLFSLTTNMLRFVVGYFDFTGPRITLMGPGLNFTYPTGGYCVCPQAEVPIEFPEGSSATFTWSAEPTGACESPDVRAYRWALDIADVFDQTPRIDEETDLAHWSAPSANATSATLGANVLDPGTHWLYIEAGDDVGLRSLGIIRIEIVPTASVDGLPGAVRARAWPNPTLGPVRLDFDLHAAGVVRTDVFDLSGRRIRTLASKWFQRGAQAVEWDGRLENGERASDGVYVLRVRGADFASSARVVVSR